MKEEMKIVEKTKKIFEKTKYPTDWLEKWEIKSYEKGWKEGRKELIGEIALIGKIEKDFLENNADWREYGYIFITETTWEIGRAHV